MLNIWPVLVETSTANYAFPELPNSRILPLATSFTASLAGPRIFRGSKFLGELVKASRTVAVNAKRKSVSMLIFAMPNLIAFWISVSGMPFAPLSSAPYLLAFSTIPCGTLEAPCRTSGIPIFSLIVLSLSRSGNGGDDRYGWRD